MKLEGFLPVVAVVVGCTALLVVLAISTLNLLGILHVLRREHVVFEITPPVNTELVDQFTLAIQRYKHPTEQQKYPPEETIELVSHRLGIAANAVPRTNTHATTELVSQIP